MSPPLVIRHPVSALVRALLLAGLWVVFAGPDPGSWVIGAPTVLGATWASLKLSAPRPRTLSPAGTLRFLPFFLVESLRGGIDVAWRVLRPAMAVRPGLRTYRTRLRNPSARLVFVDSISLLPGTLSADLRNDVVTVHALDVETEIERALEALEGRVAALFDEPLDRGPGVEPSGSSA